jgi:hypothetical protein
MLRVLLDERGIREASESRTSSDPSFMVTCSPLTLGPHFKLISE